MRALGVGWAMQDAMYFDGERFQKEKGAESARRAPPLKTALRIGVNVGAGTDANRVASYNPFVALRWMLDGKTVGGTPLRGAEETPTREEALRIISAFSGLAKENMTRLAGWRFLEAGCVDLLGSDAHRARRDGPHIERAAALVEERFGEEVLHSLTQRTPGAVVGWSPQPA